MIAAAGRRASPKEAAWHEIYADSVQAGGPDGLARAASAELADLMRRNAERLFSTTCEQEFRVQVDPERARFGAWYELFPRSCSPVAGQHGAFKDVEARLPYVAGMGFDVLYLPPIHPIGDQFRKGRNNSTTAEPNDPGSPWAIGAAEGGHKAVHPELGTLDDFRTLVSSAAQYGLELALDDFGTGYSSLAYLMRFPVDLIKIDQSFVRDIVTEPNSAIIAVSIIGLAHRMGMRVIAEGVETEAQLGYLAMQGCDEMQGYYFSRPVPAAEFAQLVKSQRTLPERAEAAGQETLLLLDDEPGILSALRRELRGEGYRILVAGTASEAFDLLARNRVQVILSDQRMPEMCGTDFLIRVKEMYPDTVRLILSGYADMETVVQAINEGAIYKFLSKPWEGEFLREQLREAFRYYAAIVQPRQAR